MSKFAKLFDVGDDQVLFQLRENDAAIPGVTMTTKIEGLLLSAHVGFGGANSPEVAWEKAEKSFNKLNQENADSFHKSAIELIKSKEME